MDNLFYDSWLLIGTKEHAYSQTYPIVRLLPSNAVVKAPRAEMTPGYWCRYANRLRNGNLYRNFTLAEHPRVTRKKITTSKVVALYTCAANLLVQNHDSWALFDAETLQKIKEGEWYENGSSFYSYGSGFFAIHRKLDEISAQGELLSRTRGIPESDLRFHEVASIGGRLIISGYQTYPMLPEPISPFGFVQSVPKDGFTVPDLKTNQRKIRRSNLISFFEENSVIPAYLDDKVIQPLQGRIAIFSHDMEIVRVIEGNFTPDFVSSGPDSVLYLSGIEKNTPRQYSFDVQGGMIYGISLPKGLGQTMSPPLVANDNLSYVVGMYGIAALDEKGKALWTHKLERKTNGPVFPVLYNDVLAVCFDNGCRAINKKGEIIFNLDAIEGTISTPLIRHGKDNYFIGTTTGLHKIEQSAVKGK